MTDYSSTSRLVLGACVALSVLATGCIEPRTDVENEGGSSGGGGAVDSGTVGGQDGAATDGGEAGEDAGADAGDDSGNGGSSGSSGASGSSGSSGAGKGCKSDDDCSGDVAGFPCKAAACNLETGVCDYSDEADGQKCGDGDKCTQSLLCKAGKCHKTFVDCDDGKDCTTDKCDPAAGCQNAPASGVPCNDGNKCTTNDGCVDGTCKGLPKECTSSDKCTKALCDETSGDCKAVAVEIATGATVLCDDGKACTEGDKCSQGVCKSGPPKSCADADNNPCTLEGCQPQDDPQGAWKAGDCVGVPASLLGAIKCDDGDPCTKDDKCGTGNDGKPACTAGKQDSCDDGTTCTKDACDPKKGCQNTPDDTAKCDDGDDCTEGDACKAGKCQATPKVCKDGNICTKDECLKGFGCKFFPDETIKCEDGQLCTTGDTCTKKGACKAGSGTKSCDDGNECTTDSCSNDTGCVHAEKKSGSQSTCSKSAGQCWYGSCVVPKCGNFACEWGEAGKCSGDCPEGGGLCKVDDTPCVTKCVTDRCGPEEKACKDATGCTTLRGCVASCGAADHACRAKCVNAASNDEFVAYYAFNFCRNSRCYKNAWLGLNCPQGPTQGDCIKACRSGFCMKEETLCFADAKCKALNECVEKCPSGQGALECQKKCDNYTDKPTFELWDEMVLCTNKKCQLL